MSIDLLRLGLALVCVPALSSCALLGVSEELGRPGTDVTVPPAAPELAGGTPQRAFDTGRRVRDLLMPDTLPRVGIFVPTLDTVAVQSAASAPPRCMPNAVRGTQRTRRTLDFDSIRKLTPAVRDSLAELGALPRLEVPAVLRGETVLRMPVAPLDSTGSRMPVAGGTPCVAPGGR
jgi:hypothetical protein